MSERGLTGRAAAPGICIGPAVILAGLDRLAAEGAAVARAGSPAEERAALAAAIVAARDELAALATHVEDEASRIMGVQVALLEDEALSEGAFAAIDEGTPAAAAWRAALDGEIAGYLAATDEYFRARAADLADLRDRVLGHLLGGGLKRAVAPGSVVVARDLAPSVFLGIDWSHGGGVLLGEGSPTSHVAMLARARNVPMVVGIGTPWQTLSGTVIVDGTQGTAIAAPLPATIARVEQGRLAAARAEAAALARAGEPAVTRDGTPVAVLINVAEPGELDKLDPAWCDGIGLVRTEFLLAGDVLRDEERQFALYRDLLAWAAGRPVTVRTLDAGGDKPIPGYTVAGERNPFLGMRGIRLSLRHADVFAIQLRALARAAALGPLKVMLPMVTTPAEIAATRRLLALALDALQGERVRAKAPALGIMVEVPGVAAAVDRFDADFFSIGSNDLTQYVTAASRDGADVAEYAQVTHPGVLRLIAAVAAHGAESGREVSLCGDAGGDPQSIPALLDAGVRTVSVAPTLLARSKAAIRAHRLDPATRADWADSALWARVTAAAAARRTHSNDR